MDLVITTPPSATTIDKDLVKSNKRIRHTLEDTLIDFWIAAADEYVERRANIALMEQTLELNLTRILPEVSLPRPPLLNLVSAVYTPKDGVETPLTVGNLVRRNCNMLPVINTGLTEADGTMKFIYTAGRAEDDAAEIPPSLRQAVLLLASHYVTSREAAYLDPKIMMVEKKIAFGVDKLIANHTVINTGDPINGGY